MTEIFIVRHGNTFDKGETVTRVGARTDLPLSSSGQTQAEALAIHFLATVPDAFSAAYCSPLLRTRQTADSILAVRPQAPVPETLEFLREIDYGPDENQPEADVIARIGEEALAAWDTDATPPPGWEVDPPQIERAWHDLFETLAGREDKGPVLIVTSNGIARFALSAFTAFDIHPDTIKLKTGAYGHVRVDGDDVRLVAWNVRP